jgi:hypothetical protein
MAHTLKTKQGRALYGLQFETDACIGGGIGQKIAPLRTKRQQARAAFTWSQSDNHMDKD